MQTSDTQEHARMRVEQMVRRYTEHSPYVLNPDPVTVKHVLFGLARNVLQFGRWYCPCRQVTGDVEMDRANICPCPQHHEDIARDGVCECGIFVSRDYAAAHMPSDTKEEA
jgi:ferredoxin-thioredoxin reductase catalytic chain